MDTPATAAALQIDLDSMLERFGGDIPFAIECAELLESELPGMLELLHEGVRARAADQVQRTAHTLKGALSNFCDHGPTKTAAQLDLLAREGRLEEAPALAARLDQEVLVLLSALRGMRA
jgi:HPt (histidine-containing phosphotransfer) domain-containing protein